MPGRVLRLSLEEPSHTTTLHAHLGRQGHAYLTEAAAGAATFAWLDGHTHEIALPLVTTRPPAPAPRLDHRPLITNARSELPGTARTRWLYAKLFTDPRQHDAIIATQLPALLTALRGDPDWWFVRYRDQHETDHLRLRIRTRSTDEYAATLTAVGAWAERLRAAGSAGRLVLDTYAPEVGRYGGAAALDAAEAVFAADSRTVHALLAARPAIVTDPLALAAVNMVAIVIGFFGGTTAATDWLLAQPRIKTTPVDRRVVRQATDLARRGLPDPTWPADVCAAWRERADVLSAYRQVLPASVPVDDILESLLHMHHNRIRGIDRDAERACRRLARQIALTLRAHAPVPESQQ